MTLPHHGGDLAVADALFGAPAGGWVDLSTGINPVPYPARIDPDLLNRLPDTAQIGRLQDAAADVYGVGSGERIAVAPGTQALIQWLPRVRPAARVCVVSPTYGEHAPAWRMAGSTVIETRDLPDAADADVVVVTCPNNPDGRRFARGDLIALAAALANRGGLLIVDEAFADADGDGSIAAAADTGVVALRSFGKFYGLPGLRLGFALGDSETAASLAAAMGPWPVSTLAAEIGATALADADWRAATIARLESASARLDALLAAAGLEPLGGTVLFRLASFDDAAGLFERLGRAGVYVRHFPDNDRWLRFGLPGRDSDWARLEKGLGL